MRILITGDLSRPDGCEANVRWLATLLEPTLKAAFPDAEVRTEYASDGTTWEKWAEQYESYTWSISCDLLIGWELPPAMKRGRYVDLGIHPVRYCDDVFFAVESSEPVPQWAVVPESVFEMEATLWKARVGRQPLPLISSDSTLLVGQAPHDRSLIHDGKFASLHDYVLEEALCERLWFKAHPYAEETAEAHNIKKRLCSTNAPIYTLLGSSLFTTVVGLSSSVLTEARYFGKRVVCVLPERKVGVPVRVESLLNPCFWGAPLVYPQNWPTDTSLPPRPNRLRESLNLWWGYPKEGA